MWYLINPKTGFVRVGATKTELSVWWNDCHRAYKVSGKWVTPSATPVETQAISTVIGNRL